MGRRGSQRLTVPGCPVPVARRARPPPLLWYASFSPALTYNYVNATAVQLAFAASPPLYTSEVIVPPEQLNADTVQVGAGRRWPTSQSQSLIFKIYVLFFS